MRNNITLCPTIMAQMYTPIITTKVTVWAIITTICSNNRTITSILDSVNSNLKIIHKTQPTKPTISSPITHPIISLIISSIITDLSNSNNQIAVANKILTIIIPITPKTSKILTINKDSDHNSLSNKIESIWQVNKIILNSHKLITSHGTKWSIVSPPQEIQDSKINSEKGWTHIFLERKINSLICTRTLSKIKFKKLNQKWKSSNSLNRTDLSFQADNTLKWCWNQLMTKLANFNC